MKRMKFLLGVSVLLVLGMFFLGCSNSTNGEGNGDGPTLPASKGTNEVAGKEVVHSSDRTILGDGTYKYYEGYSGNWELRETGSYSWDSESTPKTVTFAPDQIWDEGHLVDRAEYRASVIDFINTFGDEGVAMATDGKYTTVAQAMAHLDEFVNEAFALKTYAYELDGSGDITNYYEI
jgi:hypothetical protein